MAEANKASISDLREVLSPLSAARLKAQLMDYPHWGADETALYLGVTRQRLNALVHEGKIQRIKGVSKEGIFSRDQVMDFLAGRG